MQTVHDDARRNTVPLPPSPLPDTEADALIRTEFAALRGSYLDVAARGPLPASAERAAAEVLRAQAQGIVPKAEWLALVETVRAQVAALIGADPDEIAFTKNASEGLNIVAAGLQLAPGDRIVVAPVAEHPNNVFPFLWQAQQRGAKVVSVTPETGEDLEDALIRHIDARTKLVAVTAVDFSTGRRTDLAAIGAACRAMVPFCWLTPRNHQACWCRTWRACRSMAGRRRRRKACWGCMGWACCLCDAHGPNGSHLSRWRASRWSLRSDTRLLAPKPAGGCAAVPDVTRSEIIITSRWPRCGRRWLCCCALARPRWNGAPLARRNGCGSLAARDIPLLTVSARHRSHIISIADRQGAGHDKAEIPWVNSLSAALTQDGVAHSVRRGAVRLSSHVHVLPEVAERAMQSIEAWHKTMR